MKMHQVFATKRFPRRVPLIGSRITITDVSGNPEYEGTFVKQSLQDPFFGFIRRTDKIGMDMLRVSLNRIITTEETQ